MSTATIPDRPYLSPPEVAELLGVAAEKVCGWIHSGELRATNVATSPGGRPRYRVHRADLEAFLVARASDATPKQPIPRRQLPRGYREYIPHAS